MELIEGISNLKIFQDGRVMCQESHGVDSVVSDR